MPAHKIKAVLAIIGLCVSFNDAFLLVSSPLRPTPSFSLTLASRPSLLKVPFLRQNLRHGCPLPLAPSFSLSRSTQTLMSSTEESKDLTLEEQAAIALQEAAAAEDRAKALRQAQPPKTAAPSPPPKTESTMTKAEVYSPEDSEKVASELASEIGKLQRSAGTSDPLSGTRWLLRLDFGREEGTWMDARWGASGSRVKAVVAVELMEGGQVKVVEGYNYGLLLQLPKVKGGKWRVEGSFPSERLKFELEHSGLTKEETRCDVDVPEGKLFLGVNTLGTSLGKQGGLSIEQFRFYVRRERRMVGVFKAERLE